MPYRSRLKDSLIDSDEDLLARAWIQSLQGH
jgi:hypothetical protein